MKIIYPLLRKQIVFRTKPIKVLSLLCLVVLSNFKLFSQTPLKQESGSLTTANGPISTPQVVTYYDGASVYSPTTTVTYTYSNQQYGTGTAKPLEGMPTLSGMLFGGNSVSANTAPAGFPRNSLMNGISSPTDALFKACAACAAGSITVANDYAVGLQSLTDGFIDGSNNNLQPLNARIYMGDLTISFSRPVSNPVFQFVGMGGQNFYGIDGGGAANDRNYEMGWATEFDLVGTDVVLSKFAGNSQLTVTGAQITNNATFKGASSVGAAIFTGGVTRFAASGSILATGTNITSITLKVYIQGDGGRITNGNNVVVTGLNGHTPQWSLAPNNYTNSTVGTVNSDVYLIGTTLQKPVTISGNVFNDPNAGNVNNSSGAANVVPAGMFINLIDSDGNVVTSVSVPTTGIYTIPAIFEGTYTTSLTTTQGTQGSLPPAPSTPAPFVNTGEFNGTPDGGTDGTVNGISQPFTVAATDISNINFGIAQPPIVTIAGNVFNDPNGLNVNNSSGATNLVPSGMTAVLVNSTGNVVANATVGTDGVYSFPNIAGNASYTVVLATTTSTVGTPPTAPGLPTNWTRTGDFNGAPDGGATAPNDGISAVINVVATNVSNINFGIQQRPETAVNLQPSQVNPGGTSSVTVPPGAFQTSNVGVNPNTDDPTTGGTVASINIPTFPTGATSITVGGTTYLSTDPIWGTGGINVPYTDGVGTTPAISVDPVSGAGSVIIPIIAIDNLGVPDLSAGSVTLPFTTVTVAGNVFNDPNAANVNNSTGSPNLVPAGMDAVLVDNATGFVVANTTIGTDGVYTFGTVDGGNYRVVLANDPGAIGSAPPAAAPPTGFVNTGEFNGAPDGGNTAPINGVSANFAVTNANVTNINFGIEEPPTANTVNLPSQINPGGTVEKTVTSSFGGTDPSGGIISSLTVTSLPANVTSITLNNIKYGTCGTCTPFPGAGVNVLTGPTGVPTSTIKFDPVDGAVTVTIPYITIDNAGVPSPIPGNVVSPFIVVNVSGNVFNDVNGLNASPVNTVDGIGIGSPSGTPLYASLLDPLGNLIRTVPVGAGGAYSFPNVTPGNYSVVIHQTMAGNTTPSLPTGWVNTGENNDPTNNMILDAGNDGNINGQSDVFSVVATDVINVNFGIEQPPTANTVTLPGSINPGGTVDKTVTSSFGGTDPSSGIISSLTVTALPNDITSITINGIKYGTCGTCTAFPMGGVTTTTDAAGVPISPIKIDPIDGAVTVTVPYNTTDNAGKVSLSPGSVVVPFVVVNVSGNVFNDVNGLNASPANTVDGVGIGSPSGTPLFASLLDPMGNVISTTPVNAGGNYSFLNVTPGNYSVVIHTTMAGSATPNLPTGWVPTGENNDATNNMILDAGSDGNINGQSDLFSVTSTDIINVNFGIEQPPAANTVTLSPVINPGGTVESTVTSSFGGTDPSGGIIASLTITALPNNITSITINAIKYGTCGTCTAFPMGGVTTPTNAAGVPTSPIKIDPIDGAVTVNIPYKTTDNAGKLSVAPGAVNVPFVVVNVSGNVFNDINGLNASPINTVDGIGIGSPSGTQLFASLLDGLGNVIRTVPVGSGGVYSFLNVTPGNYSVVIHTTSTGSATPNLPMGWLNTGENNDTTNDMVLDAGNDGNVNGQSDIFSVVTTDIINVNFGIEQPPTANIVTLPGSINPGSTVEATVTSSFGGTDPSGGIISSLIVTSLPNNVTSITLNGIKYGTCGTCTAFPMGGVNVLTDPSGVPTSPIKIDPVDGPVTVNIPYVTIDNAGKLSPIPGAVNVPFVVVNVSGNVFNDVNGLNPSPANTVDGIGIGSPSSTPLFASLLDGLGNVIKTVPVNAGGDYFIANVTPGNYSVVIHTTSTGSNTANLPMGWLNTGENNDPTNNMILDAGSDGIIDGKSDVFSVNATDVINVNFGIEQPPTANIETAATIINPGGTISSPAPATVFGGTDPSGGIITAIKITAFPTGATSITIGPNTCTDLACITAAYPNGIPTNAAGEPTIPISVDPIATGTTNVVIPYITVDNAGKPSPIPGSATVPFIGLNISGNVFNDPNAGNVNNSILPAGPNVIPAGMTAYLIQAGVIVAKATVATDGTFSILDQPQGTYTVVTSTVVALVGASTPISTPPIGYLQTGEFTGLPNTGNDGTVNGTSAPFTLTTIDQTNVNFAIQQPPTANIETATTVVNPGGTISSPVPADTFGGTDPNGGTIEFIKITAFPTGATSITIGPNTCTDLACITAAYPNGIPTNNDGTPIPLISVDPIATGTTSVVIPYNTIDNGGATSPIPGSATLPFIGLNVSGNVFNDPNAGNVNNSILPAGPNVVPAGMTAYLVQGGVVVGLSPVATNGTFQVLDVPAGTGYSVIVSTATAAIGASSPAATPPTGYLQTGEFTGTPDTGTDGTVNGISVPFALVATNQVNVNFGIQQPPTANIDFADPIVNPGGLISSPVPASTFGGTDPNGGVIKFIQITEFPTGATSITIGSTTCTTLGCITTAYPMGIPTNDNGTPIPAISVDPTANTTTDVIIPYVTVDNAGAVSPIPGSATIPFTGLFVSGTVFNDPNAGNVNNSVLPAGPNVVPTTMTAYLVQGGLVVGISPIGADGIFEFADVPAGVGYTVIVSTAVAALMDPTPTATPPSGFLQTGEFTGTPNTGNDGTVNGVSIPFNLVATNQVDVNFGIQQPPTANIETAVAVINPGGTISSPVPADTFGGTDPNGGTIEYIQITSFPTVATSITIGPNTCTTLACITAAYPLGIPTNDDGTPIPAISVDPILDGITTVVIPYVTIDNAGTPSPVAGSATVPFLEPCFLEIGGTIFIDNSGTADGIGGTPVNGTMIGINMTLTKLVANVPTIVATSQINSMGTYKFSNLPAGTYTIVMATGAMGSTTTQLPSGYITVSEGGVIGDGTGLVPLGASSGDGTNNGLTTITVDCISIGYEHLRVAATASYLNNNFGIKSASALPVSLVNFNANKFEKQVNLDWKTANETEFSHFEVERSANAKEFGSIGKVTGNQSGIYNLVDANPMEGNNYYRLRMVDLNGKSELSKVITVNFEVETEYISIENPAINGEFKLMTNVKNAKFTLMNSLGKVIDTQISDLGNGTLSFKVANSVSGYYFLNIESNGKFKTKKVIIP